MAIEREILHRMQRNPSSSSSLSTSTAPPPPRHSPRPPSHDSRQAPPPQLRPSPHATPQQLYEQRTQQIQRAAQQSSVGGAGTSPNGGMSITGGYKPPTTAAATVLPPASLRGSSVQTLLGDHPPDDILYLKCNLCNSTYGSVHNFRRHFAKAHGPRDDLGTQHVTIQSISQTKSERANRQEQMDTSTSESKPGHRDQRSYSGSSGMSEDSNSNTGEHRSTMKCLQCGMEFSTRNWGVFRRHMRTHEGGNGNSTPEDTSGILSCGPCKLQFGDADDWRLHMSLAHESHSCICRICDTGFATSEALHKHMKSGVHTNSDTSSGSGSSLPEEASRPPREVVEYRCLQCALAFASEQDLYAHTRALHRADKAVWAGPPASDTPPHVRRATPDSTSYEAMDKDSKSGESKVGFSL